jgi:hypothetical protein
MKLVSISDLAEYRLGREAETGADFDEALLPMLAGCEACYESLAAWNAYPTKSGYVRCGRCIGDLGWHDAAEANAAIFGE